MYCKSCGKEIADNSAFCQYCGASIQQSTVPAYQPTNQNGTITFYREKSAVAKLMSAKILIDGKTYGDIKENERCSATLPYGAYDVEIKVAMNPSASFTCILSPSNPNPFFAFKVDMTGKAAISGEQNKEIVPTKSKKTKKHGGLLALIVIVLLAVILINLGKNSNGNTSNSSKTSTTDSSAGSASEKEQVFKPVSGTVGDWDIKVNEFTYSESVSVGLLHEYKAEDNCKYCVVNLTVKNNGKEAATFLPIITYGDATTAKVTWEDLEFVRSELVFSKDNLSTETLNPLVSTSGDIAFELPDDVIESDTPPTLIISNGYDTFSCELTKK